MPVLKTQDRSIHYAEAGAGHPVLLVHSGGYTGTQWRKLAEALRSSHRLLSIDLHGCDGTTPWPGPGPMGLSDEGRLVRELALACGGRVHLVGHSYGGAVAIRAVLDDPAPYASLVLMEPIPFNLLRQAGCAAEHAELLGELEAFVGSARAGEPARAVGRFAEYWNARPGMWAGLPEEVRAQLAARVPAMLHQCLALRDDPTALEDCGRIRVPTLLLHGDATHAPMKALVDVLHRCIPGSRRVALPGLGHMAPATHHRPVAEALDAGLREMSEGGEPAGRSTSA
jgi:pimeloyl-ACP methyl ester carboxylesterase